MSTRVVGTTNVLRRRRRILSRVLTHRGLRTALDKVRGATVDASVVDFLRPTSAGSGPVQVPRFVQALARAFGDAQDKRHDADYDLNKPLSETDARLLLSRVQRVIGDWRGATSLPDKDFKHALSVLILLKGQLRSEQ